MVRECGRYLRAVHIHTSLYKQDNYAIPCITNGDPMDWPLFCMALDEVGFTGNFNLEIRPPRNHSNAVQDAYYQLAYLVAKDLMQ